MDPTVDLRFKTPSCLQIVGISQSGKSSLTAEIIRHRKRLFTEAFKNIVWIYQTWQPLYDQLQSEVENIVFKKELDEVEKYTKSPDHTLLVLDDAMANVIANSVKYLPYFIMGSHHNNNTIILLTQSIFIPKSRLIQIACHYLIIFELAR